ncbi:hypothetical protein HAX54_052916 [Datura stramonium]|uniref:Uncharacterized protein n=1 Tax=Datura stramonium TaxID=4076 RepID=A0ABS8WRY3_DATST|nr:hypothetical protein [Datura stramonium]
MQVQKGVKGGGDREREEKKKMKSSFLKFESLLQEEMRGKIVHLHLYSFGFRNSYCESGDATWQVLQIRYDSTEVAPNLAKNSEPRFLRFKVSALAQLVSELYGQKSDIYQGKLRDSTILEKFEIFFIRYAI